MNNFEKSAVIALLLILTIFVFSGCRKEPASKSSTGSGDPALARKLAFKFNAFVSTPGLSYNVDTGGMMAMALKINSVRRLTKANEVVVNITPSSAEIMPIYLNTIAFFYLVYPDSEHKISPQKFYTEKGKKGSKNVCIVFDKPIEPGAHILIGGFAFSVRKEIDALLFPVL